MTQTDNRLLDELAKAVTNAAGAAQGMRREVESIARAQIEKIIGDLDLVTREQYDVVHAMAARAREENDELRARVEALEARIQD